MEFFEHHGPDDQLMLRKNVPDHIGAQPSSCERANKYVRIQEHSQETLRKTYSSVK